MKQVYQGDDPLGEYSLTWDGTDNSNSLVPPGLYLYRIVADVQSNHETNSGILAVAYDAVDPARVAGGQLERFRIRRVRPYVVV